MEFEYVCNTSFSSSHLKSINTPRREPPFHFMPTNSNMSSWLSAEQGTRFGLSFLSCTCVLRRWNGYFEASFLALKEIHEA
jgi:hypothetical protein